MAIKKYKTDIIIINKNQTLRINGANAFTLVNTGTGDAKIKGFTIAPGDSYSDNGWPNEENFSEYQIELLPGAQLTLFLKLYI